MSPRWRYASEDVDFTAGIVLTGINQKEVGPVQTAREVLEITLTDVSACFVASMLGETLTIITTQSSIVGGSRLQKRGRVSASILACTNTLQSNLEPK